MPKIDIYYSKVCGLCTEAINFFHKKGVTFTAIAIEYDPISDSFIDTEHTRKMHQRCGENVEYVPQIFIGERHIGGWRKTEELIHSGEIDSLLTERGE